MYKSDNEIPDIVQRAYDAQVTNIGQLSKEEIYQLEKFVKSGYLMKYKTYNFPIPKTTYGMNWNDFVALFINEPDYILGEEIDV